ISGIWMSEMDGFQTAKLIRSRRKTKNIPIVFLTAAYKSEDFKQKGLSLGATDYLTKPIDDYQLTTRIKSYLSIIRLERDHKRELERKVTERTRELAESNQKLETALEKLQNAQRQVIAQEKLASLGELTAGIAHEIKNPLNFIINFSELSQELVTDMQETVDPLNGRLSNPEKDEIHAILMDLRENAQKINEHGKRADSIINNMLVHSYEKKGVMQETPINTMLQEYASLSYHSMLNNYKGFACTIEYDLDPAVKEVKIIPQDMSRVFLNLLNNAFYALYKKSIGSEDFRPVVELKTIHQGDKVEIVIRDNGLGIPEKVIEKIFNPFFTTKPPGEGTGLGLSICYDIVRNIHKGDIQVASHPNEFTEFSIFLPL
ncbi:MAG: ATP-binding protein, partial [Bacteroidota bacterium]